MEALSLRLLPVYATALGLPIHFFDDAFSALATDGDSTFVPLSRDPL